MIYRPSSYGYHSLMQPDLMLATSEAADDFDLKHALAALDMPEAPEANSERGRAIRFLGKFLDDQPFAPDLKEV